MLCRVVLVSLLVLTGCATVPRTATAPATRPFEFHRDTFAFANELAWVYQFDPATGQTITETVEPPPDYVLRCFVLARSARQFVYCAEFQPSLPAADPESYRQMIRHIARCNPRERTGPHLAIPGYADLRSFSIAQEQVLKKELGGAWQSYLQRGNWRMIFPFSRRHQQNTATELVRSIQSGGLPIVHVVRFPALTINHAILLFDAIEDSESIRFLAYDPNQPQRPLALDFRHADRSFQLPRTRYFAGGRVDVYEIYRNCCY